MLEVGSGDFSISVRGFQNDDPATAERVRAFCKANFGLSAETTDPLTSHSDTIVLTLPASEDELRALAKVLREIGALVEISRGELSPRTSSLPHHGSVADIQRIFRSGHDSQRSSGDFAREFSDPPRLTPEFGPFRHDATLRKRRSQAKNARAPRLAPSHISRSTRQLTPYVSFRALIISLSVVCAATIGALTMRHSPTIHERTSLSGVMEPPTRRAELPLPESMTNTLHGTLSTEALSIEMRALISNSTVSISSLTITIHQSTGGSLRAQGYL